MVVIAGFLGLAGLVRLGTRRMPYGRAVFVVTAMVLLWWVCAARSTEFGSDTATYVELYTNLRYQELSEFWSQIGDRSQREPVFWLVSKVLSELGLGPRAWLGVIAGVFCLAFGRLVYRHSDEPYLSVVTLVSLGYLLLSMSALRQTVALSILLVSYESLRRRRLVPFVALVLAASLFHASALVFLVAYPLARVRIGPVQYSVVAFAVAVTLLLENPLRELIAAVAWTESIAGYAFQEQALNWSGFVIQAAILAFCLVYRHTILGGDAEDLTLFNLLFVGLAFQALAGVIAEGFRISWYFSIFACLLIPRAIASESQPRVRVLLYTAVLSVLVGYLFISGYYSGFALV